jgi:hypothetical protein
MFWYGIGPGCLHFEKDQLNHETQLVCMEQTREQVAHLEQLGYVHSGR